MAYWSYVFGAWLIEADWPHPKLSTCARIARRDTLTCSGRQGDNDAAEPEYQGRLNDPTI